MKISLPAILLFVVGYLPVRADITLPPIFSDHMVLQKSPATPIWGRATSGEEVSISLADKSARTAAGPDGKWRIDLDLSQCGPGPFQMTVKGANEITIQDVLVGDVWLASGQSNMAASLHESMDSAEEVARSANAQIRQFEVRQNASSEPSEEYTGRWTVAGPETAANFTAVGYYFGKELQKELGTPIGILNSSFGGTYCESWMTGRALAEVDMLDTQKKIADRLANYPSDLEKYAQDFSSWEQQHSRNDRPTTDPAAFAAPDVSTADWQEIKLPARFSSIGLPDAGVVWLRKDVDIPEAGADRPLRFDCGNVRDFTAVYWNGVKVAETTPATPPGTEGKYTYIIPAAEVKAGRNVIAVRVHSPRGDATLEASPSGGNFRLINDGFVTFLPGDWLAKAEYELPALEASAAQTIPSEPRPPMQPKNVPGSLYNAMIHPIVPYGIRGVIWYQGESNTGLARQYRQVFPALIKDWRTLWNDPALPFYFCSLAAYGPMETRPGDSAWAELREAQHLAAQMPRTGEAILIDIGEEKDIHPRNKKDAGERLAKVALRDSYGRDIPSTGPTYQAMQKEGGTIRLRFAHTDGGLSARALPAEYQPRSIDPEKLPLVRNSPESELEGFAICGADKQWKWADACIDGNDVIVKAADVSDPIAVRYGWADNPIVNLYNGAGFPAVPFRTDDFPGVTSDKWEE